MSADVSVVVPCFNGSAFIASTVRTVLTQPNDHLEVIVVDDGSTDDSHQIVEGIARTDPRVRLVRQANAGVAEARNVGLGVADPASRLVMFLDADDLLEPGALHTLAAALSVAPDASAAAGTCFRIGVDDTPTGPSGDGGFDAFEVTVDGVVHRPRVDRLTYRHLLPANAIWSPGQCLIRRQFLGDAPFDRRFSPCEDWEFWLRLTRGSEITTVAKPVLGYRDHPASASKQYAVMRQRKHDVLSAQVNGQDADGRQLVERAYWFAMYEHDDLLCRRWAHEAWSQRRWVDCGRFCLRAVRTRSQERGARRRSRSDHWSSLPST